MDFCFYMRINDIAKNMRPRERFLEYGSEALSEAELLAIILRTGTIQENVIEMSNRLISTYGLENLFECSLKELQNIKGIGISKALQILSVFELSKRYELSKKRKEHIKCAKDVFDVLYDKLKNEMQENFYIILLNSKNRIIKTQRISLGILDASLVHPREVFRSAIRNSSNKIILAHNHPSGDCTPSKEDIEITKKLIDAGKLIGIEIIDHVIIGDNDHWSWNENNI